MFSFVCHQLLEQKKFFKNVVLFGCKVVLVDRSKVKIWNTFFIIIKKKKQKKKEINEKREIITQI